MDRITEALLAEFSREFSITLLPEDERFEHFAAWLTVRRHYSETTFDPSNLVTGKGNDTGIDAIAVIVNNNIVFDVDDIEELLEVNGYLDVAFVFVQAERTAHFDSAKIGTFGFGVRDFFGEGKLLRNDVVRLYAEIMNTIYANSSKFIRNKPSCHLYYVTTGRYNNDTHLVTRADAEMNDLRKTGLFSRCEFAPVGVDQIQKLYQQTKNTTTREFNFDKRVVIPPPSGVAEAYLGFLPAKDFLAFICDPDDGSIIKSLFYENIRDWVGYNQINSEIRETLLSDTKDRFILMNNGVTMIARTVRPTGDKFLISDYQIVNGCQTSHVLHDNAKLLTDSVRIPFRLVSTQDESVIESIIRATNRQIEVKEDQFFAMKDFAKKLEAYFKVFPVERRIYYERRAHQYDPQGLEKIRIIVHTNLVRAVGAMFLQEPHATTKNFRALSAKVGEEMFKDTDKFEPYYVAGFALFRLEQMFKAREINFVFKATRYQILLIARLLIDSASLPPMNSNEMARRCSIMMEHLWDDVGVTTLFSEATTLVERFAGKNWDRYSIRTETVTKSILDAFKTK